MAEAVFLDACVLYPDIPRKLILDAAGAGLVRPAWTARVIEEWRIAAARRGLEAEDRAQAAAGAMRRTWPGAEVEPDAKVEASLDLPDRADVHVVAGAVAAGARTILTFNLRDFPARRLAATGVAARHPDGWLWELLSRQPDVVRPMLDRLAVLAEGKGRRLLKRAGLPRLGKAWEAGPA